MRRLKRIFVYLFIAIVMLYAGLCGALIILQRSLIYYPQPRSNQTGATMMTLKTEAGPVFVSARPRPGPDALIYFGGNAEDVSLNLPGFSAVFPSHSIYLLHYRGYGGSSGSPSEKAFIADALALFDQVHDQHKNIVVVGRSLGTGVAVHLASVRPVARLVLITPFDSLGDVAAWHYPYLPVRWLLRDKFNSGKYAPQVKAPTRIIAAEEDEVIPRASTELLRTRFRNEVASYVVIPACGHNTISDAADYLSLLTNQ
jgi:pimeloyl-ACP methyl ester carboxylesterase